MRKMTLGLGAALAVLVLTAAPALAQKDPFHPVIDPDAGTTVTTDGTTTGTTDGTTTGAPGITSDGLADTGGDPSLWLALASGLLAIGTGALVIARMHQPQPLRHR